MGRDRNGPRRHPRPVCSRGPASRLWVARAAGLGEDRALAARRERMARLGTDDLPARWQCLSFRGRRTSLSTITINKVNSHKLQYRTFPSFPEAPAAWTEGAVACSGPTPRSEHAPRADTRRWRSPPTSPRLNDMRDPGSDSPRGWPATAAPAACHVAAVCHAP